MSLSCIGTIWKYRGDTPLLYLCTKENVTPELLEKYLTARPDAGMKGVDIGKIPLHYLCLNSSVTPKLLEKYLVACPDAGMKENDENKKTPLHYLCINEHVTSELLKTYKHFAPEAFMDEALNCGFDATIIRLILISFPMVFMGRNMYNVAIN